MSSGYIVALAVGVWVVLGLSTFTAGRQGEKPESGFRPKHSQDLGSISIAQT
jgi:hypothetical protein